MDNVGRGELACTWVPVVAFHDELQYVLGNMFLAICMHSGYLWVSHSLSIDFNELGGLL